MPYAAPALQAHTVSPSAVRRRLPRAVAILIGLGVLIPMAASQAPTVESVGGSCTGWESRDLPPETIRVGRRDGSVEKVAFRRYVGVVMASEWPGWLPEQAREAGAVAVKQYAWFYTLAGEHRSSYVNERGQCFDVKDGTVDQLYKPELVSPDERIWKVVDATWGLHVRKSGRFFLTGYRAGTSKECASDVDGFRLYAKSVIACARRGWSRKRIQETYYAPGVTFHWASREELRNPPLRVAISPPAVNLETGMTLDKQYAQVTWDHKRARPSGTEYQLQRLVKGTWSNVKLADPTLPRESFALKSGVSHQFRVRLRDWAGRTGPWHTGPRFDTRMIEDKSDRMNWSPTDWRRVDADPASGNTVTYSRRRNSQSALFFEGRAVAVVATTGPDRGRAKIVIDGRVEAEVDLYSTKVRWKVLVFTREWADSQKRVIRVDVEGTANRPRVDLDGILFHR